MTPPTTTTNKICSVCGQPWEYALSTRIENGVQTCLHDSDVKGPSKIEKRRKENASLSAEARQQAGSFARTAPREETIMVKDQATKKTAVVPKKLVDNLTERIKPVIGN